MSLIEQLAFTEPGEASFESGNLEYELEVYINDFDIDQIKSLATSYEGQEQWGVYIPKTAGNASDGSIRVRKTIHPDGGIVYEFCTKTSAGDKGKVEEEDPSREGQLEQFRRMADQGLIKTRYNVPGKFDDGTQFTWQVDTFTNKKGELVPWAKIDVELKEARPQKFTADEIPFLHSELIVISPEEKAAGNGQKEKIQDLYEKYFRTGNLYV